MFTFEINTATAFSFMQDLGMKMDYLPTNQIAKLILKSIQKNFKAGGRPDTWAPKKDGEASYLLRTSNLYNSFFYDSTKDEEGVTIWFDSELGYEHGGYADYLDQGTKNKDGTERMVARPFFLIQDEDENKIWDILASHFS